jgi:hypothetical protein
MIDDGTVCGTSEHSHKIMSSSMACPSAEYEFIGSRGDGHTNAGSDGRHTSGVK